MKVLVFSPSDGSIWHIPAEVIANHRAAYYAEHDTDESSGDIYEMRSNTSSLSPLTTPNASSTGHRTTWTGQMFNHLRNRSTPLHLTIKTTG